jgi:ATP-dependent DNA helicase RecG
MKSKDKVLEMERFIKGKTQIMVATTVIEVGVNVPNASVMIIESAERFGLSQLHQLRGRVGRGADQSYCVLMTDSKLSQDALTRMETMSRSNDGFEIAEVDLKLRGPGNMMGTQQSGVIKFKIADLIKDHSLLKAAREETIRILKLDPLLKIADHQCVKKTLAGLKFDSNIWNFIS